MSWLGRARGRSMSSDPHHDVEECRGRHSGRIQPFEVEEVPITADDDLRTSLARDGNEVIVLGVGADDEVDASLAGASPRVRQPWTDRGDAPAPVSRRRRRAPRSVAPTRQSRMRPASRWWRQSTASALSELAAWTGPRRVCPWSGRALLLPSSPRAPVTSRRRRNRQRSSRVRHHRDHHERPSGLPRDARCSARCSG